MTYMKRFLLDSTVATFEGIPGAVKKMISSILGPILACIGLAAVLYAIYLGVMYAKAESADKRKEVQGRLIGACIGAVIIIVGATLCFALQWDKIFSGFAADYMTS